MTWPHAPTHRLDKDGTFIVTGSTYLRKPYLDPDHRKERFMLHLFALANHFGWELKAWSILKNHYHFIADSSVDATNMVDFIAHLHRDSAKVFNEEDGTVGRKVWFQYWDSRITYHKSYMARLNYVHNNPVKHGVCLRAEDYHWCSKAWHIRNSTEAFRKSLDRFNIDQVRIRDDFDD